MSSDRKSGFTLVEAMIAGVILMFFVGGFVLTFIMAMRTVHTATNHYRATSIARNRIQRARAFDFGSLELLEENEIGIDQFGNSDPGGRFRRSTSISTNWATPHTVRIRVGVRYPLGTGANLSAPVVVESLIAAQM